MAQVTMTSQEYLEMVEKIRRLEQLEKEAVDGVEITLDPEGRYGKYSIHVRTAMTDKMVSGMVSKIVDSIKDADYVMDELVGENRHFLDLQRGVITYNWNDQPEEDEVDLLKDKNFKAAWDRALARMEEPKEENDDMSEE